MYYPGKGFGHAVGEYFCHKDGVVVAAMAKIVQSETCSNGEHPYVVACSWGYEVREAGERRALVAQLREY